MQFPKGQGALEYLLLIGGAVVVAAIVVVMLLGFGRTGANQANSSFQNSLEDIYGDGGAGCGNGTCDAAETAAGCPADCGCDDDLSCEPGRGETATNCDDCSS